VLAEHKLRDLKGFGEKSEEKLTQSLARLEQQGSIGRTPISVALPLARKIVARLAEVPGVTHASTCGSLRRFSETIGDVDILVSASDPERVMEAVVSLPAVDTVLGRGTAKTSIVTRRGTQVDVRVVAPEQLGAALLYFTGSKGHNIKLRQRALARGWTLNEYALSESRAARSSRARPRRRSTARWGLAVHPPVLREDAARSRPPRAARCRGRSAACTATSTCTRRCRATADRRWRDGGGARSRAATGSWPSPTTPRGRCPASAATRSSSSGRASARMQAELGDKLKLLHGVELNIGPAGELDYDLEFRRSFDWCLASVHDHFELDRAAQTRRIVTAMQGSGRAHDRPPVGAHDRRAAAHRSRLRPGVRGGRGDRHGAGGERRPAAPGPVGRGAAPRARAQRHVPARQRRARGGRAGPRRTTRRSTPSARGWTASGSRTPGTPTPDRVAGRKVAGSRRPP
jgi:DNA polymerase (family 10)